MSFAESLRSFPVNSWLPQYPPRRKWLHRASTIFPDGAIRVRLGEAVAELLGKGDQTLEIDGGLAPR